MVSKIMPPAKSFYHICRYVCQDQHRARILDAEGVRAHDYKLMAEDFESQREIRQEKEKAVFHSVLSYSPGEQPADTEMVELARKYLDQIGMAGTQFVIARHTDKNHAHMHIIANRVDNEGKSIEDSWIGLRAKKVAQKLTNEYQLVQANKKDLKLTHRENLNESEARRYRVFVAIKEVLPHCNTLEQLEKRLEKKGIDVQYRYKEGEGKGKGERQGISFRLEKECFKGSQVDREFLLKGLQQTLAEQEQRHRLEHSDEHEYRQSRGIRNHF